MIAFKVEITNLNQILANLQRAPLLVEGALQEGVLLSQAALASVTVPPIVPYKTGQLSETFFSLMPNPFTLLWGPTVKYASFVEFGTAPHLILPRNKKALFWQGAKHPVRAVHHPGSAPNPYMERILEQARGPINDIFNQQLKNVLLQLGEV